MIKPTLEISSSGYDFSQKSRRQRKEGYEFSDLRDSVTVMTHAHCSVIRNLVLGVESKGLYFREVQPALCLLGGPKFITKAKTYFQNEMASVGHVVCECLNGLITAFLEATTPR